MEKISHHVFKLKIVVGIIVISILTKIIVIMIVSITKQPDHRVRRRPPPGNPQP